MLRERFEIKIFNDARKASHSPWRENENAFEGTAARQKKINFHKIYCIFGCDRKTDALN
jgi:hypothetical protein